MTCLTHLWIYQQWLLWNCDAIHSKIVQFESFHSNVRIKFNVNNKRQHKTAWKMCSVYINKITKKISKSRITVLRGSEIKCISRSLLLNSLILHSTQVIKLELKTRSSIRSTRIRRRRRGRIKGKWNKKKTNFFNSKRAIDVSGTAELCKSQKITKHIKCGSLPSLNSRSFQSHRHMERTQKIFLMNFHFYAIFSDAWCLQLVPLHPISALHQTTLEWIHTHTCVLLLLLLSYVFSSGCSNARKIFCAFAVALIIVVEATQQRSCVGARCVIFLLAFFLCIGISASKKKNHSWLCVGRRHRHR